MTGFGFNVHGFGAGGSTFFNVVISSSVNNFNLGTHLADNFSYNGSDHINVKVTIDADVVIGASGSRPDTAVSFDTGTIGADSFLTMINNGTIQGQGGRGGTLASNNGLSTNADGKQDRNGGDGGTAFKTTITTTFENNGSLLGGGGGGGASGVTDTTGGSGGGGGAGTVGGVGGSGNGSQGGNGANGSASAGGSGGSNPQSAGNGGGVGANGTSGSSGGFSSGGSGGTAGNFIDGDSKTTFTVNGTRTGGTTN